LGRDPGEQGSAEGRAFRGSEGHEFGVKYIRQDFPPSEVARAAARGANLLDRNFQLPEYLDGVAQAERHPFQDGADEVRSRVTSGQTEPHAARLGVEVRRPLAHQVGQPQDAATSRGNFPGLVDNEVVNISIRMAGVPALRSSKVVAEPAQGESGALSD